MKTVRSVCPAPLATIALFATSLFLPAAAGASISTLNTCTTSLNSQFQTLVTAKVKLINACATAVARCMLQTTQALQDSCIAAQATAARKPCNADHLDPMSATSNLGKALAKFKTKLDAACQPSDQGGAATHPTFDELVHSVPGSSPNADLANGGLAAHEIRCVQFGFPDATTTWNGTTGLRDCLARAAGDQADQDIHASNSRAFAALQRVGMATISDPVPIGDVNMKADIDFRVTFNGGTPSASAFELVGFSSTFTAKVSGLDTNGIAQFTVNPSDAQYTSSTIGSPSDASLSRVCLTQVSPLTGSLCCNPAGCSSLLGSPNYTLNLEHDSSGNNAEFPGTGVGSTDPSCTRSATYVFGGQTFTVLPCVEGPSRAAACNGADIGTANPFAHFPKCVGGARDKQPCDPSQALAGQCPGGTACQSLGSYGFLPLTAPPCNSVPVLTRTAGTWDNGGLGGETILRLDSRLEKDSAGALIDSIDYGAGCANKAGDGYPDSSGCDAIPCTADDPPAQNTGTIPFLLTTGTASTTIFDANMEPTSWCPANPGTIASQQVGFNQTQFCQSDPSAGSVPVNGCANLSQNNPSGYELVGTFGSLDTSLFGDGAISMRLRLRDPLAP